jgi:hypothetical protein
MAQRGAPGGWDSLPNPPSVLRVTVESAPRRSGLRLRAGRLRVLAALSLVGAVAGVCAALVAGGIGGARHGPARIASAYAPIMGVGEHTRGIEQLVTAAGTYRFPLGCMGMTLTPVGLAGALRDRTGPCWRYGVFVTAILRRVDGMWRLALEATSRSCPHVPLPAPVRAQLAVCRR